MPSRTIPAGYLIVDHRASPGLSCDGLTEGSVFEADIYICSHCQRGVMKNPLRERARGYCPKCDHYVCDDCETARVASGGACKTFKQLMDEVCEQVVKTPDVPLILPLALTPTS